MKNRLPGRGKNSRAAAPAQPKSRVTINPPRARKARPKQSAEDRVFNLIIQLDAEMQRLPGNEPEREAELAGLLRSLAEDLAAPANPPPTAKPRANGGALAQDDALVRQLAPVIPARPAAPEPPQSALRQTEAQAASGGSQYQLDLGGMAAGQAFNHDECVAIFCLALAGVEKQIREAFIPELETLGEEVAWLEVLAVAKFIVRRRTLGRMTGDAPATCFRLPLPGVAGMAECSYFHLMDWLSSVLWKCRAKLAACVIGKVECREDAALFGEALELAEYVMHKAGVVTDLEDEFPGIPNHRPSATMRCAWNWKAEAVRAAA